MDTHDASSTAGGLKGAGNVSIEYLWCKTNKVASSLSLLFNYYIAAESYPQKMKSDIAVQLTKKVLICSAIRYVYAHAFSVSRNSALQGVMIWAVYRELPHNHFYLSGNEQKCACARVAPTLEPGTIWWCPGPHRNFLCTCSRPQIGMRERDSTYTRRCIYTERELLTYSMLLLNLPSYSVIGWVGCSLPAHS